MAYGTSSSFTQPKTRVIRPHPFNVVVLTKPLKSVESTTTPAASSEGENVQGRLFITPFLCKEFENIPLTKSHLCIIKQGWTTTTHHQSLTTGFPARHVPLEVSPNQQKTHPGQRQHRYQPHIPAHPTPKNQEPEPAESQSRERDTQSPGWVASTARGERSNARRRSPPARTARGSDWCVSTLSGREWRRRFRLR